MPYLKAIYVKKFEWSSANADEKFVSLWFSIVISSSEYVSMKSIA